MYYVICNYNLLCEQSFEKTLSSQKMACHLRTFYAPLLVAMNIKKIEKMKILTAAVKI